jgi:hypothetical protein
VEKAPAVVPHATLKLAPKVLLRCRRRNDSPQGGDGHRGLLPPYVVRAPASARNCYVAVCGTLGEVRERPSGYIRIQFSTVTWPRW